MNKQAQIGTGGIILGAIAIIVCLILFQASATNVEQGTQTVTGATTKVNATTAAGPIGTITELPGQELVSIVSVKNISNDVATATNYTIAECIRKSDNLKGICYTSKAASIGDYPNASGVLYITYTYYPSGYIDDAGARSVAGIILVLTAIGIAMVMLPKIKEVLD